VAGLLFVGAGLLGVGTLEDLALVLFVGMLTGAYSSLFLATPWLVDLKMLDQRYKLHAQRVLTRRAAGKDTTDAASPRTRARTGAKAAAAAETEEGEPEGALASAAPRAGTKPAAKAAPKPGGAKPGGGRPQQPRKRSGGKRR